MIFSEHIELVPDRSKKCSLDCCKAYSEVLEGRVDYGLKYDENQKINLHGYVDSYWTKNTTNRRALCDASSI